MSIQERILQYIENKGITPYKFCKDLNFPMGYLNKRGTIGTDKYLKIIKYHTDLNPEWLLTGEGEMLKNVSSQTIAQEALPMVDSRIEVLLKEKIALLEENKVLLQEKIAKLEADIQALKSI